MRLFRTVQLRRRLLVEPLQGAVVTLVQPPVPLHRQPHLVHLRQRQVMSRHGPGLHRRVRDVEPQTRLPPSCARRPSLPLRPSAVSGTSCQPVNRFSRFHVDCPWRRMTSVPVMSRMVRGVRFLGHDDTPGVRVRSLPPLRRVDVLAARHRRRQPRARHGRGVRHLIRRSAVVARHGDGSRDRRPRHEAGSLGRRQHPRRSSSRRRWRRAT